MGMSIGPTSWWQSNIVKNCPVGTTLPDGSKIVCKNGGTAWIVAPLSTQVSMAWAGGQYNSTLVGDKCCISEWNTLQTCLITSGFNPADWFVPNSSQLQTAGYACRGNWDSYSTFCYWSSTEGNTICGCGVCFGSGTTGFCQKICPQCVRAMRCVTY